MGSLSSFRHNSMSTISCWGMYGVVCVLESSKECIQLKAKLWVQNIYGDFKDYGFPRFASV